MTEEVNNKFKKIDEVNKILENTISLVDEYFDKLEHLKELGEAKAQQEIDKVCIYLSNKVNEKLSRHRKTVVEILHNQYTNSMDTIALLQPLATLNLDPTDLSGCVNAVNLIIKLYAGPYEQAVKFIAELAPKLNDLIVNCSILGAMPTLLPSRLGMPNINFDKLKIDFEAPSMNEIVTGMPNGTPEKPEVPKEQRQYSFSSYEKLLQYPTNKLKDKDKAIVTYKLSNNFNTKSINFGYSSNKNYYLFENIIGGTPKLDDIYFEDYIYKNNVWQIVQSEYTSIDEIIQESNSGKGVNIKRVYGYGASKPLLYDINGYTNHVYSYSIYKHVKKDIYVLDNCKVRIYPRIEAEISPPVFVDIS